MKLFLWMFWEKILTSFKIMLRHHSQMNKLTVFCFQEALSISWNAILCWTGITRRSIGWNLLNNLHDSSSIWISGNMVFLCLESKRISFQIHFATSSKVMMILRLMRSIALNTLRTLYSARGDSVIPLLTVLALGYPWVHICTSNHCYVASNIEIPVDQAFCLASALNILNINLDNGHVWFRRHLDYARFWC